MRENRAAREEQLREEQREYDDAIVEEKAIDLANLVLFRETHGALREDIYLYDAGRSPASMTQQEFMFKVGNRAVRELVQAQDVPDASEDLEPLPDDLQLFAFDLDASLDQTAAFNSGPGSRKDPAQQFVWVALSKNHSTDR